MRPIDADALQQIFNEVSTSLMRKPALTKDIEHMVRAFLMTTEMINDAPTIEVEPVKHGTWIFQGHRDSDGRNIYCCSNCNMYEYVFPYNVASWRAREKYCAGCGALMDGGAD
jgi:hypothetical protein